jgi:predicted anti-sigma-YlaC factor YlaD
MNKKKIKMDCKLYRERIDDYVEGKLGKVEEISFEKHLHDCPECSDLVRIQKLSYRIIAHEKSTEPNPYLAAKIMAGIESRERNSGSALVRILKPVVITVSVAAAIFAGVLIGNIAVSPTDKIAPVELTLMNDNVMEAVNVLSEE